MSQRPSPYLQKVFYTHAHPGYMPWQKTACEICGLVRVATTDKRRHELLFFQSHETLPGLPKTLSQLLARLQGLTLEYRFVGRIKVPSCQ